MHNPPSGSALSQSLTTLGSMIDTQQPDALIREQFTNILAECERMISSTSAEMAQLRQAISTWDSVWPRLGHQPEFRAAVAREAHLWAKRLSQSSAR